MLVKQSILLAKQSIVFLASVRVCLYICVPVYRIIEKLLIRNRYNLIGICVMLPAISGQILVPFNFNFVP